MAENSRFNNSNNPVLSRYEQADQPGFAYEEGRAALAHASGGGATTVDQDFARVTAGGGARLTLTDVIMKTAFVFAITVALAVVGWNTYPSAPYLLIVAMIVGLGLGFVNALKAQVSPVLVALYAVAQGYLLGAISYWYNDYAQSVQYEGLVQQAVIGTMTAFAVMLFLYGTGIVKVTGKFKRVMLVSIVSYAVIGLASLIAALFGVGGGWGFYGVGTLGLLLCLVGVALASFTLMLDFEAIKQGIANGAPERESWRMAFGLLMTLVWLYLEILRFLAIFAGRD
ncbi:MAG: Bax inhibitor-1/YccA family protein [Candidatus Nanopelagicales bacterium]|nr:Bax inhibitor-1/YccA family protein [Candidatus Nanopelagicales bacterium]